MFPHHGGQTVYLFSHIRAARFHIDVQLIQIQYHEIPLRVFISLMRWASSYRSGRDIVGCHFSGIQFSQFGFRLFAEPLFPFPECPVTYIFVTTEFGHGFSTGTPMGNLGAYGKG